MAKPTRSLKVVQRALKRVRRENERRAEIRQESSHPASYRPKDVMVVLHPDTVEFLLTRVRYSDLVEARVSAIVQVLRERGFKAGAKYGDPMDELSNVVQAIALSPRPKR